MKIRAFPNPSGAAYWRLIDPFKYMREKGMDAQVVSDGVTDAIVKEGDVFVLQSTVSLEAIAKVVDAQRNHGKKIVAEFDDWIEPNDDNPNKQMHQNRDAREIFECVAGIADMVTTTTKYLADKLWEINHNVVVLPNAMDMERWQKPIQKNTSDRVRIGWAGSLTHWEDVKMTVPVLTRILDEFPQTELVLVGDMRFRDLFPGHPRVEVMIGVPFESWPMRLHGLRLDIGVAPLRDTVFNRCKSNIKWQEYSIAGVPGVYSDIVYNRAGFAPRKLGLIARTEEEWYTCLRNLVISKALREDMASSARADLLVRFDLKKNIHQWVDAYKSLVDTHR